MFGIPACFLAMVLVSLLNPPPDSPTLVLVDHVRYPAGGGKTGVASPPVE